MNLMQNTMTSTNTLNSHHGESRTSRADKMSGVINDFCQSSKRVGEKLSATVKRASKQFYARKRRMMLKNPLFFEKI